MGLKGFERRLERLVEGVFARAFRSSVRPVELGRRLVREMDDQRTVDVKGQTAMPNDFTVTLGAEDHEQLSEVGESLTRELAEAARSHAKEEGAVLMGPVAVHLQVDDDLGPGQFGLSARFKEGPGGTTGGALVLPGGDRVALEGASIIGRSSESTVQLNDTSVSRRHAELRPTGDGWMVVDLGSTNGTRVNGAVVSERKLTDGDKIAVGDCQLTFEAG